MVSWSFVNIVLYIFVLETLPSTSVPTHRLVNRLTHRSSGNRWSESVVDFVSKTQLNGSEAAWTQK